MRVAMRWMCMRGSLPGVPPSGEGEPDFPDEARPLIGPRFRSGVRLWSRQAVRCWRAEQGGAPERSDAERPSQSDGPHGRVHEQPNPPPKPCQGSGCMAGERAHLVP